MEKSKWANLVINLSLLFVGAASISGGVILFDSFFGKREIYIASAIINFIFCISFFISIYQLKRIVKNVIANKIFIEENVKRFNIISYPFFIISIISCFINNREASMVIMGLGDFFAIKIETVFLLTLGSLALVMAYIFSEAIRIKKEAEKLEEESKYTI